jgi:thioredoxin reductase
MTIMKIAHGAAVQAKVCGMVQLAAIATGQALSLLKKKWMTAMTLTNWPFPPATGAVPWTAKQIKQHAQQQRQQTEDAPL